MLIVYIYIDTNTRHSGPEGVQSAGLCRPEDSKYNFFFALRAKGRSARGLDPLSLKNSKDALSAPSFGRRLQARWQHLVHEKIVLGSKTLELYTLTHQGLLLRTHRGLHI